METVRENSSKFGRPMDREREGHTGGGQLFVVRREGDLERGLLTERGHNNNYLAFQPGDMFMRVLGDDVLRVNEALFEFRGKAVEHVMALDDDGIQGHYGELKKRFEVVRDRLMVLTDYCNKGYEGLFDEASEVADGWFVEGSDEGDSDAGEVKAFGPLGPEAYESVRQRNLDEGILTAEAGEQGYVAFRSCPFYGRVVGEIIYTLNDAVRRVEGRTPQYVAGGQIVNVRRFYVGLMRGMKLLRGELQEAAEFCREKIG